MRNYNFFDQTAGKDQSSNACKLPHKLANHLLNDALHKRQELRVLNYSIDQSYTRIRYFCTYNQTLSKQYQQYQTMPYARYEELNQFSMDFTHSEYSFINVIEQK